MYGIRQDVSQGLSRLVLTFDNLAYDYQTYLFSPLTCRGGGDLFPRTLFSDEHEIFRASVRRFVETEITPHHAAWEKQGMVPRELWRWDQSGSPCCPS